MSQVPYKVASQAAALQSDGSRGLVMSVGPTCVHRVPDAVHGAALVCAGVPSGEGEALAETVSALRTAASHVLVRLPADVKAEGRSLKDYAHALVAPSAAARGRAGEEGRRPVERLD